MVLLSAVLFGCGAQVPHGGVPIEPRGAPLSRRIDPGELLSGDLDLVVRVDLAKLTETLGTLPKTEIARRLASDPLVLRALAHARSITLGLRMAHLDQGDRLLVLEGDMKNFVVKEGDGFSEQPTANDKLRIFVRTQTQAKRDAIGAIVLVDERAVAFASVAQTDALLRVVSEGADNARGAPARRGVLSADIRIRRLDPALERRFPSVARVIGDLERVRGGFSAEGNALLLEFEIRARSEAGRDRAAAFLGAMKGGADPDGVSAALSALEIERSGTALMVRAKLPAPLVLRWLSR